MKTGNERNAKMKSADVMVIFEIAVIAGLTGLALWKHSECYTPVTTTLRCRIGQQIIYEGVTTNREILWHTTSNGPWIRTFHGVYSVALQSPATVTTTQRFW